MTIRPHLIEANCRPGLALVVRHAELLPEAVGTALQFRAAAERISFYLLEPAASAMTPEYDRTIEVLKTIADCCYCNHQPTVKQLGLTYAEIDTIAEGLVEPKWVLTF